MGSSSRGKKRDLGERELTLRRRLHDALYLGIRSDDNKGRKWECSDVEIQSHVLRAMNAFIGFISSSVVQHPLVKDSIADMLVALEAILQSDNERILNQAAEVTLKLVRSVGNSIFQYHVLEVINSLLCLLSSHDLPVLISCASALDHFLINLGSLRHEDQKEVWKAVEKTNAVGIVVCALQDYVEPLECFLQFASLLRTILWRWVPSRYHVWTNTELLAKLGDYCTISGSSITVSVLQLYSAIALCGDGTMRLLESKVAMSSMIEGMGTSKPVDIRIEALKLCQHLMRSSKGNSILTSSNCESIVQGIINAMGGWRSCSKNVTSDQKSLVIEACRTALLTRWAGNHHACFWDLKIEKVLLGILFGDCNVIDRIKVSSPLKEVLATINDNLTDARPYVWDILGWLAIHCEEIFFPKAEGRLNCLNILISCACSMAKDLMHKGQHSLSLYKSEIEPLSRAVLQMIFSPCKYIALKARYFLSEEARPPDHGYLEYVLASLKLNSTGDVSLVSDSLQTVINMIGLACYSALPRYQKFIVEKKGVQTLCAIIKRCLDSDIHVSRLSIASHLHSSSDGRICCWSHTRDWEGGDVILFHDLQALSQLIWMSDFACNRQNTASREIFTCIICANSEAQILVESLEHIMSNSSSPGVRWYAEYILTYFGLYGFPSELGKRMKKALNENKLADFQLTLSNGQSLGVHGAILLARCPALLPPEESPLQQRAGDDEYTMKQEPKSCSRRFRDEVRISDRVDNHALMKILEYVYTGFFQVDDDLMKSLKILAKVCGLKYLSHMLHHKLPRWGTENSSCDFSCALEDTEHVFSDVILEAELTTGAAWSCSSCQVSMPHVHAHKIILWSNCDYLQALFQSGMHDSYSQVIKVPIGWIALLKLVHWFYTGELPRINLGCAWNNMDFEKQLYELQAYVELSSLAEFWLLEEVREESFHVLLSSLSSDEKISLKIIQVAADLDQWNIVEAVVRNVASMYPKMRDTGVLEDLDERLVEILRAEYVHHSQEGHDWHG